MYISMKIHFKYILSTYENIFNVINMKNIF